MKLKDPKLFREQCYIDGKWVSGNETYPVYNPSKGSVIGNPPKMGGEEAKKAIAAAAKAFLSWRAKTAKERGVILRKWYELILEHVDDLAIILSTEQGKPVAESVAEIRYGASFVEWFSEEGKRAYGDTIPPTQPNQHLFVVKEPVGVVAAITPWNWPSAMITRKCAPALAAGCTIVLKAAETTPFSAFALAELAERAGIPPGVLNVLVGDPPAIGKEMTSNPTVRKLSFTGSTKVGKMLMAESAATVKKLSLELGGSAPFIVFADANIPAAVEALMATKFRNCGQGCTCADRVFVEDPIYDKFTEAFVKEAKALKVGDAFDTGVQLGPLINTAAVEKIERHVQDALSKGAKVLCGGKRHSLGRSFFEPTVVSEVTTNMAIAREETFGPAAPLIRFRTEEEVIAMANDTEYGLASYIHTKNIDRLFRVAEALEFGIVSANGGFFHNEVAPFGGFKESGIGREGSKYGLEEFLEIKYICLTGG